MHDEIDDWMRGEMIEKMCVWRFMSYLLLSFFCDEMTDGILSKHSNIHKKVEKSDYWKDFLQSIWEFKKHYI